jgi:hypothetical protein
MAQSKSRKSDLPTAQATKNIKTKRVEVPKKDKKERVSAKFGQQS